MIQTTKKCNRCKEIIVLDDFDFVKDKEKYYHFECYIIKLTTQKREQQEEPEARKNAELLRNESRKNIKVIMAKDKLYKWLQRTYDVVSLPSYFFVKMDSVYNGTYKNLTEGICAEDLLDMWQRKIDYLNKTASWKNSRGEKIEDLNRIWYDLAILMTKFGSYKKWKEEQRILEIQNKAMITPSGMNFNAINNTTIKMIEKENYESIADFLEEI
jgi:hypothetical protein